MVLLAPSAVSAIDVSQRGAWCGHDRGQAIALIVGVPAQLHIPHERVLPHLGVLMPVADSPTAINPAEEQRAVFVMVDNLATKMARLAAPERAVLCSSSAVDS
jgi:hypothetical protein